MNSKRWVKLFLYKAIICTVEAHFTPFIALMLLFLYSDILGNGTLLLATKPKVKAYTLSNNTNYNHLICLLFWELFKKIPLKWFIYLIALSYFDYYSYSNATLGNCMSLDTESWVRHIHIGLCRECKTAIINFDRFDLSLVIDLQKQT